MVFVRSLSSLTHLVSGASLVSKFGRNADIDTASDEDVWTVGGTRGWLNTASAFEVVSSSTNDTSGGAGAQAITIQGLDAGFNYAEEDVTLAGTSASSATTTTWMRVNRAFVKQVGVYGGTNDGALTVRLTSAGATQTEIVAGMGQTEQTHYSVAANRGAHLLSFYVLTDANKSVTPTLWVRPGIDTISSVFAQAKRKMWGGTGIQNYNRDYAACPALDGPCDIWWSSAVAANNTEVEAGFDVLITKG